MAIYNVGARGVRSTFSGWGSEVGGPGRSVLFPPPQVCARAKDAYSPHCFGLCRPESGMVSDRPALQFDGADVSTDYCPPDVKYSAGNPSGRLLARSCVYLQSANPSRWQKLGFRRFRPVGIWPIRRAPFSMSQRIDSPFLYRLRGDESFLKVYETVSTTRPTGKRKERSYGDRIGYLRRGSLSIVFIGWMEVGCRYPLREDGIEAEPHFLSMCISKNGSAKISTGKAHFAHDMQASQDLIPASVDRPIPLEYVSTSEPSASSGNSDQRCAADGVMKFQDAPRYPSGRNTPKCIDRRCGVSGN